MPTRRTTATLQPKLNKILAECIRNVESLGYKPVGRILPDVRITRNGHRLGSCKETTGAYYKLSGDKPGTRRLRKGARPVFEISCSVNAGSSDSEFFDVIYHEVIHTLPGCFSHGKEFKEAAAAVNSAFGANVQTTKRDAGETGSDGKPKVPSGEEARKLVRGMIGMRFVGPKGQDFRLDSVNPRAPKNYCRITDLRTGSAYAAPPEYLLSLEKAEDAGNETSDAAQKAVPKMPTPEEARRQVRELVGHVFADKGRRLRLDSVNPRAPKNYCRLVDDLTGARYVAPPEYVLHLGIVS